jgi:hypothetical protein
METTVGRRSALLGWFLVLSGTIATILGGYFVTVAFSLYGMFGWDGATLGWIVFAAIGVGGLVAAIIGARLLRAKH